jgi:hypothetical protein
VLLAIQDPAGSYLLAWSAEKSFDKWVFTNAPATNSVKARASAWDGIGAGGFGEMLAAGPETPADKREPGGGGSSSEPSSGGSSGGGSSPSAPAPGPTRKNTPSGPITIPGG